MCMVHTYVCDRCVCGGGGWSKDNLAESGLCFQFYIHSRIELRLLGFCSKLSSLMNRFCDPLKTSFKRAFKARNEVPLPTGSKTMQDRSKPQTPYQLMSKDTCINLRRKSLHQRPLCVKYYTIHSEVKWSFPPAPRTSFSFRVMKRHSYLALTLPNLDI